MSNRVVALTVVGGLLAAPLAAQTRQEPQLVFSIGAGLTNGQQLWEIPQQPMLVAPTGADTVALGRWLTPGIVATLGVTYFGSPKLGFGVEIGYFGLTTEQRCAGPDIWTPSSDDLNEQACVRSNGLKVSTGLAAFQATATYRWGGRGAQPYVRIGIGPALFGTSSFVTTTGTVSSPSCATVDELCQFDIITEDASREVTYSGSIAAGLAFYLGPAYRIRVEARDLIAGLPYATGAAIPPPTAPTAIKLVHTLTLTAGLDVVLVRRHERRY